MLVSGILTKMQCVATESIPSWTNRVCGSWVPLALQSAQVIAADVEPCSEQGDSGSKSSEQGGSGSMIQLLEALVRECHKPGILEYLTDLDWDCFHFFRMHKMLNDGISRGRSWKRRVQCLHFFGSRSN